MRKWLAGNLIRLAHRIYPPKVTECTMRMNIDPASMEEFARFQGRRERLGPYFNLR